VHTPESNGFSGTWEEFKIQLQSADCAVIGINDYFSVSGYKKIKEEIVNNTLNIGEKKILPIVEMRMTDSLQNRNTTTNGATHFNFHIIFNDKLNIDDLESFIKSLESGGSIIGSDYGDKIKLKDKKVSFSDTLKKLQSDKKFQDNYLIWLPYDEYGGIGDIDPNSDGWIKEEFIKKSHILGSSNQNQIDFFLWKSPIKTDGSPKFTKDQFEEWFEYKKPCIKWSDSHSHTDSIGKLKDENSNPIEKFCWIKADPTFEGLKQIVYEPEDRIKIQKLDPNYEKNKSFFESVNIKEDIAIYDWDLLKIKKTEILLNKNLVTIIWWRWEWKSTLINYLWNSFWKTRERDTEKWELNFTADDNFEIEYYKINDLNITDEDKKKFTSAWKNNNELDFIFIEQWKLKKETGWELSDRLKSMLNIEDAYFSRTLSEKINDINDKIEDIKRWKEQKDEFWQFINSETFQKELIRKNSALLENLKNSKNKDRIEEYNKNLKEISNHKKVIFQAKQILSKIEAFVNEIKEIDKDNLFQEPDLSEYKKKLEEIKAKNEEEIVAKEAKNELIKQELSTDWISWDLTSLLENTTKYQNIIDEAEKNIEIVKTKEDKINDLKKQRSEIWEEIKKDYERQKEQIDEKRNKFLDNHTPERKELIKKILLNEDKISVSGKICFNKEKFYELLWDSIHQWTHKREKLEEDFWIKDLDSWIEYIKNEFNKKFDSMNHKQQSFLELFFSTDKRSQYLKTVAEIKYDNKELAKLSAWQKGTAYLRIHLANSAFDKPIIFDQPEDDLDNKFIMDELVDIFKELKKYRQIIIVTHNANLVINSDAEQVIIAKNEDESLSYISWSLENKDIQDQICIILEWGKQAFKQREKKYNI